MRFGVVVFPGSNCDHDAWYAVSHNLGHQAEFIWHDSATLGDVKGKPVISVSGHRTYPIEVNQAEQTFTLPADGAPLMVVFDKGDNVLKSVEFKKNAAMLIYQLKNAETVPDRAEAAVALGEMKDSPDAVAALGYAAQHDLFWGIRVESLKALGKIGGGAAEKQVLASTNDDQPY